MDQDKEVPGTLVFRHIHHVELDASILASFGNSALLFLVWCASQQERTRTPPPPPYRHPSTLTIVNPSIHLYSHTTAQEIYRVSTGSFLSWYKDSRVKRVSPAMMCALTWREDTILRVFALSERGNTSQRGRCSFG